MPHTHQTAGDRMSGYALAVGSVAIATLLRWPLWPVLGQELPFLTFFVATLVTAYYGGLRPGLLATALGALAAYCFLLDPSHFFAVSPGWNGLRLFLFVGVGALMSALGESLLRATHRAEREARQAAENERRYWQSLESISDAFAQLDFEWRYTYVNARAAENIGKPAAEMIGRSIWDLSPALLGTQMETRCRTAMKDGKPADFEFYFAPLDRWFEHRLYPSEAGLAVFSADITDRKRAELENRRLLAILEATPDLVSTVRSDGVIQYSNREARRVLELDGDGEGNRQSLDRHPVWTAPLVREDGIPAALRDGYWRGETAVRTADGRQVATDQVIISHADSGGATFLSTIARDITNRKEVEDLLRMGEARFRSLAEAVPQIVWTAAPDGRITFINKRWTDFTGLSLEETNDLEAVKRVIHPEDIERVFERWADALAHGTPHEAEWRFRDRKDGGYRWFLTRALPVHDASGSVIEWFGTATDIDDRKRAEEALARERELLQTIFDRIPVMLTLYDPDTRVVRTNPEFGRIVGWTAAEAAGGSLMEQCYPDPAHREQVAAFMASCRDGWMDIRMRTRDGRDIETSWANVRLSDDTQVGIGIDISDRKRDEEELRRREQEFRTLAENTPDLIARFDQQLRHVYVNRRVEELTGRPLSEYLGKTNRDLGVPEPLGSDGEAHLRRVFETARPATLEFTLPLPGGERHFLSWFGPELGPAGEVETVLCITRDVTEQKQLEAELRRRMTELSEADRRKDVFLATLAHELRNPLAPVRTAVEVLKAKGPADQMLVHSRGIIERQVRHMARLLDDLLDVSRITRNKLELRRQPVTLASVLDAALETSRPLVEAGGHRLVVELPRESVHLEADMVRLAQVFSNLLNNAAKYTERDGQITLAVLIQGDFVTVCVRDTGIGIAPEMMPRLFEMFAQAQPALERSQGGLGIGLSLVRGIVELHGGTVEARSEGPGQGSEFVVRLPVISAATDDSPDVEEGTCAMTCRILVADDNRDAADSLATMLGLLGYEVRATHDGEEAVRLASEFRPEVVVLDIGMPRLNGYQAAERIRAAEWGRDMLLLALTGWGQEEDRRRAQEAGFGHHLTKPVDPSELVKLLRNSIRRDR
jgi:PAS domain S-box-containing protein